MMIRSDSDAIHSNSPEGIPATDRDFEPTAEVSRLLIAGASTRAAAWSAIRAGLAPVCADLFADDDLKQVAMVVDVADYPKSLPTDLKPVSADAWMITGAMENSIDTLASLGGMPSLGRYCGPSWATMAKLRDPFWIAQRLKSPHYCPEISHSFPRATATTGLSSTWLKKPFASGGGRGIHRCDLAGSTVGNDGLSYFQREIMGTPLSAVFVVSPKECRCLLVSEQLVGCAAVHAPTEFTYCGSIGPWALTPTQSAQLAELAATLLEGLSYHGLLGLDLIWDGSRFWLIEVNPRYTASCELWDLSSGQSAVGEHLRACGLRWKREELGPSVPPGREGRVIGKLILYAAQDLIVPDLACSVKPRSAWTMPAIADVPAAGSRVPAQSPICTVFASAETAAACREKLLRRSRRVSARFGSETVIFK